VSAPEQQIDALFGAPHCYLCGSPILSGESRKMAWTNGGAHTVHRACHNVQHSPALTRRAMTCLQQHSSMRRNPWTTRLAPLTHRCQKTRQDGGHTRTLIAWARNTTDCPGAGTTKLMSARTAESGFVSSCLTRAMKLTNTQELSLRAVRHLFGAANSHNVREYIGRSTGKKPAVSTVSRALAELRDSGLISARPNTCPVCHSLTEAGRQWLTRR
jgi:hypothetical protein